MTLAVSIAQGGSNNVTMRNRIINGAMMIDQRNAGASQTFSLNTGGYTVDRFNAIKTNGWSNGFTAQQVTDAPAGFVKSLKVTQGGTADANNTNTYSYIGQGVEGLTVADLNWGTANAKPVTVSFWAKSSITGTFSFAVYNNGAQAYIQTYSLPTANTWTYVTIQVAGPTSGTFPTDNTLCFNLIWGLGVNTYVASPSTSWQSGNFLGATGATTLWTTANATFQLTGVQFEAGTTATPFEQRLYGTELALCQRYYFQTVSTSATQYTVNMLNNGSTRLRGMMPLPCPMRAGASLSVIQSNGFYVYNGSAAGNYVSVAQFTHMAGMNNCLIDINVSGTVLSGYDWAAILGISAEL